MKKNLTILLFAACLCAFGHASFAADMKIGFVDLHRAFDTYHKTLAATAAMTNEIAEVQKERDAMVASMKKHQEEYKQALDKANDQAISADERDKSKKNAQDILLTMQNLDDNIRQYDTHSQTRLAEQRRTRIESIVTEIRSVLNGLAQSRHYTIILDKSGETSPGVPLVLFTNGENDLTDDLVKELNAAAPAPAASETNKPAAK